MPKKGYKQTQEHKMKIKLKQLGKKNTNLGKKYKEIYGEKRAKEIRDKISKSRLKRKEKLGYLNSPKTKEKIRLAHLGKKRTEISKKRQGITHKEWHLKNRGTEKYRKRAKKISKSHKGKKINEKQRQALDRTGLIPWNIGLTKETDERVKKNGINTGKTLKKKWRVDFNFKKTMIKKILKGLMKRPTSFEKRIDELCIENSLPFIYTGDGRFLINFKNPDFVNHKDKVVIEVFHSYFKIRDYGNIENYKEHCKKKYNSAGWKVIFIGENEVWFPKNWKKICLNKIRGIKEHSNKKMEY